VKVAMSWRTSFEIAIMIKLKVLGSTYLYPSVKSRPHQQQCRSNIVECYKLNDSFDKDECCFDIVAGVNGALHRLSSPFPFCLLYVPRPDGPTGSLPTPVAPLQATSTQQLPLHRSHLLVPLSTDCGPTAATISNYKCKTVKRSEKVKACNTRYRALGPELIPVYRQSVHR